MKLVELKPKGRVVFVGDTHGDLDATKTVMERYIDKNTVIALLGDYPDRGERSRENIDYIVSMKEKHPKQVYPLQGNHENYKNLPFSPADFWSSLSPDEADRYSDMLMIFPLVLTVGNIIALHGALPDISDIKNIEKVKPLDKNWMDILWGYYHDLEVINYWGIIPEYGEREFNKRMDKLGKRLLIRSHQTGIDKGIFNNRCLTIFTSEAYADRREVAIADFSKNKSIDSIDDLTIEVI